MENDKTNEPQKLLLNLSQRLDLRNSEKHVTFQNLSIYYTWKNIRKQYENNKLKFHHEMINLNYQMVVVLCQILKIISNTSLKS